MQKPSHCVYTTSWLLPTVMHLLQKFNPRFISFILNHFIDVTLTTLKLQQDQGNSKKCIAVVCLNIRIVNYNDKTSVNVDVVGWLTENYYTHDVCSTVAVGIQTNSV